jgi:hypothetical protein
MFLSLRLPDQGILVGRGAGHSIKLSARLDEIACGQGISADAIEVWVRRRSQNGSEERDHPALGQARQPRPHPSAPPSSASVPSWFDVGLIALFGIITSQLDQRGVVMRTGALVDATLIPSASIRHDGEARWAAHRKRTATGHVATDQEAGLIRGIHGQRSRRW